MIEINSQTDLDAIRHVQTVDRMLDRALNENEQLREADYRLREQLKYFQSVARSRLLFMLMYAAMLFLTWCGLTLRWILRWSAHKNRMSRDELGLQEKKPHL